MLPRYPFRPHICEQESCPRRPARHPDVPHYARPEPSASGVATWSTSSCNAEVCLYVGHWVRSSRDAICRTLCCHIALLLACDMQCRQNAINLRQIVYVLVRTYARARVYGVPSSCQRKAPLAFTMYTVLLCTALVRKPQLTNRNAAGSPPNAPRPC